MVNVNRERLKQGVRRQFENLYDLYCKKIDQEFSQTSEFWQCHQCRKISYDLLKGIFTYGDGFNIDKHLQKVVLKGFYSLFSGYHQSNKKLTTAQVKKKQMLQNCWRFIFLNTCHAIRDRQEAISVSLDKTNYNKDGKYHSRYWTYDILNQVVSAAVKEGYYVKHTGQQGDVSFITRLKITEKISQLINGYVLENKNDLPEGFTDDDMIFEAPLPRPEKPLVIIKEREGVYRVPKDSNNTVRAMGRRIKLYNEFMQKQDIAINVDMDKCKTKHLKELIYSLYRNEIKIFNKKKLNNPNKSISQHTNTTPHTTPPTNDPVVNSVLCNDYHEISYPNITFRFNRYSCQRIFTGKMGNGGRAYGIVVQKLPEEIRKEITINGESVVELDYSTLHPSLLYTELGIQPPPDIYIFKKGEDDKARSLVKIIGLVGFNANSEKEAVNAVRKEYYDKYNVMLHNVDILPAMELFFDHNPELKQFFGKGLGTKLQYVDSQIMDNILTTLRQRNIPAIPIYDSVVVPDSAKSVAHDVMITAYQKITTTDHIPYIS